MQMKISAFSLGKPHLSDILSDCLWLVIVKISKELNSGDRMINLLFFKYWYPFELWPVAGYVCLWLKRLVQRYLCIHSNFLDSPSSSVSLSLTSMSHSTASSIFTPGYRLRNFEIRVGHDATNIGNNAICYNQMESMIDGATVRFQCHENLYGSWVTVNKSDIKPNDIFLQLMEVRVFDGKS